MIIVVLLSLKMALALPLIILMTIAILTVRFFFFSLNSLCEKIWDFILPNLPITKKNMEAISRFVEYTNHQL